MRIGIVGAENSHAAAIAKTLNVEKAVEGFSVDYIWGETEEFARNTAEAGEIPNIVTSQDEMLGKIDALIVDHRHPEPHLSAAEPFIELGLPVFIDKPFCYRAAEGKAFLEKARRCKAPVTSFSIVSLQQTFIEFRKKAEGIGGIVAGSTYGRCDLASKHGGVFFYGVHQVAMALDAFGVDVESVLVTRNGASATGQLFYPDGKIVTLNFIWPKCKGFSISAVGSGGSVHAPIEFDESPHLSGIKCFTKMFATSQEPLSHDEILAPVRLLEALEKSAETESKTIVD